jgi:hypothetical protein
LAKENQSSNRYTGQADAPRARPRRPDGNGDSIGSIERHRGRIAMSVEIIVRQTGAGLEIVSGRRRLEALLALRDEVVVTSPGIGEMVIARLPDGRLQASASPEHVALFRHPAVTGNPKNPKTLA